MAKKRIDTKNIEDAKKFFYELKSKLYPFETHPLGKEDPYLKELYIAILCSISACDGEISDEETLFIKKIYKGVNLQTGYANLVKLGIEIAPKTVEDFVENFSGKPISYNFVTDALLLAASDGVIHDKELELISELMELLLISPKEAQQIVSFVSSIISGDEKVSASILKKFKNPSHFNYLFSQNRKRSQLINTNTTKKTTKRYY